MKVAILCESDIDEDAVRILLEAILGAHTDPVYPFRLASRGVEFVLSVLPKVVLHLHYATDADALAVVVDSNHAPMHQAAHEPPGVPDPKCRRCRVRGAVKSALQGLGTVPGRSVLKTAVGVAIPAIEAWYRCGTDAQVTEANWGRGLQA